MFTQLKPLLKAGTLLIITAAAVADSDHIRLTITPKSNKKKGDKEDGETAVLNTPLVITGTAEELDAELPGSLGRYTATRITGAEALDAFEKQLDEEKKAANARIADEKKKGKQPAVAAKPAPAAPGTEAANRLNDILAAKKPAPEATTAQTALF